MVSLGQEEVGVPVLALAEASEPWSVGPCGDSPERSQYLLDYPWDPRPLTWPLLSCSSWPPTGTMPREPGSSPKYPPSTTGPRPPTASEYKGALSGLWSTALGGSEMAPGGPGRVASWVPPTGSGRSQPQLSPPDPEVLPVSAARHWALVLGRGAVGAGVGLERSFCISSCSPPGFTGALGVSGGSEGASQVLPAVWEEDGRGCSCSGPALAPWGGSRRGYRWPVGGA